MATQKQAPKHWVELVSELLGVAEKLSKQELEIVSPSGILLSAFTTHLSNEQLSEILELLKARLEG